MDLKSYFRKVKDLERKYQERDIYVVSIATQDGGKDGVLTQVSRRVGCQLMVEGKARIANEQEVAQFVADQAARRVAHEKQEAVSRIQVQVISDPLGLLRSEPAGKE
ncbi:hypothetical protein [uncultured Paludibaculum sp.]|uniref:hypothetical protein n=1 Tax=uncultured Paludibaculum sp. TaxID=1765020 RepID=UPI002AAAA17A|nr:hypothetical protein [uncultured Paludibaculum sp.]